MVIKAVFTMVELYYYRSSTVLRSATPVRKAAAKALPALTLRQSGC